MKTNEYKRFKISKYYLVLEIIVNRVDEFIGDEENRRIIYINENKNL